jgi:hypothetical protein
VWRYLPVAPATQEAEAGGPLQDQPGQHSESLSQKINERKKKRLVSEEGFTIYCAFVSINSINNILVLIAAKKFSVTASFIYI